MFSYKKEPPIIFYKTSMKISQPLFELLFFVDFFSLVIGGGGMIVLWVLLTILTPKKLLETYFKEPHFSQVELAFMSIWPGILFRTSSFAWAVFFPRFQRKRNILDCYRVMPRWYCFLLKTLVFLAVITAVIFFGLMGFLILIGPPVDA